MLHSALLARLVGHNIRPMPTELQNKTTSVIIAFLKEIGLKVEFGSVNDDTFLPGIEVVAGGLIVDESRLLFPGDLLHEAGHLAIVPATTRANLSGKVEISEANPDVIEATAMCWSYAACVQLGIEPSVVFHAHGYHGR